MSTPEARAEYIAGLRMLAVVLEDNSHLQLPYTGHGAPMTVIPLDDQRGQLAAWARAMPGRKNKRDRSDYFDLEGAFRGLRVEVICDRNEVCERVVVGTRQVTETVPDPELVAAVPTVEITKTVEDVEWRCHSILDDDSAGAARPADGGGPAIAPTARTGAAIPPTPVDQGSLQRSAGPGHQDAGDGQGTRPAGAGGDVPAPATTIAPGALVAGGTAVWGPSTIVHRMVPVVPPTAAMPPTMRYDANPTLINPGPESYAHYAASLDTTAPGWEWDDTDRMAAELAAEANARRAAGARPRSQYGHPCIDVPPGVRVLGDPDYGQTSRSS